MNFNTLSINSSKTYWSAITWTFLHTFPTTLTLDFFQKNKKKILKLMYDVCVSVPCPICSKHAIQHFKKYNYFHESINNNPKDLSHNIYKFHNDVSIMLKKQPFNDSIIEEYNTIDFLDVFNKWSNLFVIKIRNLRLSYQKKKVNDTRDNVVQFIKSNLKNLIIHRTHKTSLEIKQNITHHNKVVNENTTIKKNNIKNPLNTLFYNNSK